MKRFCVWMVSMLLLGGTAAAATPSPVVHLLPMVTWTPTVAPTETLTAAPTAVPTEVPAAVPTDAPGAAPTEVPAAEPAETPAAEPAEKREKDENVLSLPLDLSKGMPLVKSNYLTPAHYKDPTIEMTAREVKGEGKIRYWVADVSIGHPTQLRTMPASTFSSSATAKGGALSRRANAVLSCDGDYWWRDVKWKGNYVLRQGQMYMHTLNGRSDLLLVNEDGDFRIIHKATEETAPLPETEGGPVYYEGKQIYNAFCFGPALVEDGKALPIERDDWIITEQKAGRLAIAQTGKLRYMIVTSYNQSLTLAEFADLLVELGAQTAYNLDGGNSAMMFTGSNMINVNRSTREIGDLIYFASAWPGEGKR